MKYIRSQRLTDIEVELVKALGFFVELDSKAEGKDGLYSVYALDINHTENA